LTNWSPSTFSAPVKKEEKKVEGDQFVKTDFVLYDYKTFLVNLKDMGGEGIAKTKEMFQSAGFNNAFSYWYFKYDKYGDEGQVHYKFSNLLTGWMQRCDPKLSGTCFARMLMLGNEPNLDIEGVWMIHNQEAGGNDFPSQLLDHPQLEYMFKRKLDFMNNADDEKMVREFMGVKPESTIGGRRVEQFEWWK
jgi:hypothetical protein